MSDVHREPLHIYGLYRHTRKAPGRASHEPVASYDQMFAFLVKIRSMLATPSLDSMNYISANREPLHQVHIFVKRLREKSNQAAQASLEAQKRAQEAGKNFQQAWDRVDVKANALETQTRYVGTISREMADTWRTHISPPNKPWRIILLSLGCELEGAIRVRRQMHRAVKVAEKEAEVWGARYILADDKWQKTCRDATQARQAFTAIYTEYLAGKALVPSFKRRIGWRINCEGDSESDRVWRINQALRGEEKRETAKYGAMSRFKNPRRGASKEVSPLSSSVGFC